jgi:hypothetical protein
MFNLLIIEDDTEGSFFFKKKTIPTGHRSLHLIRWSGPENPWYIFFENITTAFRRWEERNRMRFFPRSSLAIVNDRKRARVRS